MFKYILIITCALGPFTALAAELPSFDTAKTWFTNAQPILNSADAEKVLEVGKSWKCFRYDAPILNGMMNVISFGKVSRNTVFKFRKIGGGVFLMEGANEVFAVGHSGLVGLGNERETGNWKVTSEIRSVPGNGFIYQLLWSGSKEVEETVTCQ